MQGSAYNSLLQRFTDGKLDRLCTRILSPLLDYVPTHLKDIHQHLKVLSELTPQQLDRDTTALYTNVDIL